jgi:hypothetical protein
MRKFDKRKMRVKKSVHSLSTLKYARHYDKYYRHAKLLKHVCLPRVYNLLGDINLHKHL